MSYGSGVACAYEDCKREAIVEDADGRAWCGRSHKYEGQHVGRNDPCPCNSGKKFKACCISKRAFVRTCRQCGCTEKRACIQEANGEQWRCRWVAPDLCSACTHKRLQRIGMIRRRP